MRVLVTGAAGMLGREVASVAKAAGHCVSALSREDLDVLDAGTLRRTVAGERPDAVVNCAAWTDVDGAESDEAAATALNGDAARELAEAAAVAGASVLYPSTDYVFDGTKRTPYVESDPVAPQTAYGRSKLAGEIATAAANDRHFIVRTAWLFGIGGRNFVDTMLRLSETHDRLKVVMDQVGSPTYAVHLAAAIVRLLEVDSYGVHHVAGAGQCSWYDLAAETFRREQRQVTVSPCTAAEFPRPAQRPAYSVLATERRSTPALPHWGDGLGAYLGERAAVADFDQRREIAV
jgi:dTDP-4-dehydrorhamnose reductase